VREDNEIEAVAVDDALGFVYYADEADGFHKWHADPDHPDAGRELAHFARTGFRGDHEGIAIYTSSNGTGYIVCTDQLDTNSEYHVYLREGVAGNAHDHSREIAVVRGGADATDGLEISSAPLGPGLPHGVMVAMNSEPRNFLVFGWQDVAAAIEPPLRHDRSEPALSGRSESTRLLPPFIAGPRPADLSKFPRRAQPLKIGVKSSALSGSGPTAPTMSPATEPDVRRSMSGARHRRDRAGISVQGEYFAVL
jgi:hypothetical protein